MTASKQGLRGLREQAEATLLDGWGVTPALKEKLHRRIAAAERGEIPVDSRRGRAGLKMRLWLTPAVAAAIVGVVVLGQGQPAVVAPGTAKTGSAPTEAVAAVPPPVTNLPGYGRPADRVDLVTVTVKDQSTSFTLTDSSAVLFTAAQLTVNDENGNTVAAATPPPGGPIAGVEAQPGRKVVLNAEYQLQVKDAPGAMQQLQNLTVSSGGYVVDAALNKGGDGSWAGRLTLRIPSAAYTGAVDQVRQTGEVKHERQWSQDVTDQYADLDARVRIQQEYETKLTELAGKAEKFEDWLKLTQQINETRAQIERMQGSLKQLGNQVEYSTLNITLTQPAEEPAPAPRPESGQGLGPQMRWAFGESVRLLKGLGRDFLVGLAGIAPFALPLALIVVAVAAGIRIRRRRNIIRNEGERP
jgi:hypothetical protein